MITLLTTLAVLVQIGHNPSAMASTESMKSLSLARETLESNIVSLPSGLYLRAGGTHFGSLWTRDFAWAAQGLLEINCEEVVHDHLNALLDNMGRGGLIPRVLDSRPSWARVFLGVITKRPRPIRDPLKPEYRGEHRTIAIDSNLLVLMASLQYVKATEDHHFWQRHSHRWPMLLSLYEHYTWNDWIVQEPYGDWQDSVKREGVTFLTNFLLWQVRQDLLNYLGPQVVLHQFSYTQEDQDQLIKRLWDEFYLENHGLFRTHLSTHIISIDGNLLALARPDFFERTQELGHLPDSLNEESARSDFYQNLKKSPLWSGQELPGRASYPEYPRSWRSFNTRIVGLHHYHDSMVWTWLTGLSLKVAAMMDDKPETERIIRQLDTLIERDNGVTEIWNLDLTPFKGRLYRSENPFSWGAGLIIEGIHEAKKLN